MDDNDFLQGLKNEDDEREEFFAAATSFLANKIRSEDKQPEPLEKQALALEELLNRRAMVGAALGAGALGLSTYLSSKPRPRADGSMKSEAERGFDEILARQRQEPETSFGQKMKNRYTELGAGLAKTFREHPGKAALTVGAPLGAAAGFSVARLLGAHKGK